MTELVTFNAFGLAKITRIQATITVTAVTTAGKAVNRTLTVEFDSPISELNGNEFASISFGALIEHNKKAKVAVHEFGEKATSYHQLPEVQKALQTALDLLEKAVP